MTFDPSVPLSSDSPALFPAQNQTNMARIQAIVGNDHQFNLAALSDDGYHNLINMTVQAPSGALANIGRLYAKSSASRIHAFYMDDTGAEYQVSPSMPIRAAVNFNGTGAVGAQTMRSQFNVASVTKSATGLYTVTFTTAMPNANYIAQVTGMKGSSGEVVSFIQGAAAVATSQTAALVKIGFENKDGTAKDVLIGSVVIMSVT